MSVPAKFRHNRQRREEGDARRAEFIKHLEAGLSIDEACAAVGVSVSAYKKWRERSGEFRARADIARVGKITGSRTWTGGFAAFRKEFFGMDTPVHQQMAVEAYETTPAGQITLILWPPEHGKTSLFEDYANYKLAIDPSFRIVVGSEKQEGMSRKILARVKSRMSSNGPSPRYVKMWGPFEPQSGAKVAQPWGADYFSVYRASEFDERDYSMVALGINSSIAGTRCDHLHLDDVQSLRTKATAEQILEVFRQDWLTRPGQTGRTTINGTRVAEADFYEQLIETFEGTGLLRVIRLPAIKTDLDGTRKALWPGQWPLDKLDRQRTLVGPEAWARNYMQAPRATTVMTFTTEVVEGMRNRLRSIGHTFPNQVPGYVSLDPAIAPGHNVVMTAAIDHGVFKITDIVDRTDRVNNEQILNQVEEAIVNALAANVVVTDVVIETMAFQKGLAEDSQLRQMQDRWGFTVHPHMTGLNKYDESIGVPSMARDMRLGKIETPFTPDDETRGKIGELEEQLYRWRPGRKGNVLRQDQLMTLWFAWILYRARAGSDDLRSRSAQWRGQGLSGATTYKPMVTATMALGRR